MELKLNFPDTNLQVKINGSYTPGISFKEQHSILVMKAVMHLVEALEDPESPIHISDLRTFRTDSDQ